MSKATINEAILSSYLTTLLWSECFHGQGESGEDPIVIDGEEYESGTPIDQIPGCDVSDLETLAPEIVKEAREDLEGFQAYCLETLGIDPFEFFDPAQVAHDFCLSRNGHGAGFFDDSYTITAQGPQGFKGDRDLADDLQDAAKTFGTIGLMVWTDESGALKMESHG